MRDEIFLLSIEEYEKYKDGISNLRFWWWLRSSGCNRNTAAYVRSDGSVNCIGYHVYVDDVCIRPALRLSNQESPNLKVGQRFIKYDFPWIYLGDNIAIAEVPIATRRFDDESNDYATSEIRQFLKDWRESRDNG